MPAPEAYEETGNLAHEVRRLGININYGFCNLGVYLGIAMVVSSCIETFGGK
jgi:hypothetical protein